MKRLISLLVTLTMLAGMCVSVSASETPTYNTYVWSGNINTTVNGIKSYMPAYDEIVSISDMASNPNGRYGNSVYRLTQSAFDAYNMNCDSQIYLNDTSRVYTEGEKVHITAEMMIPTGGLNLRGDYSDNKMGISVTPKMGADAASATVQAQGIRVSNRGNRHATRPLFLAAFDGRYKDTSRRFSILGGILTTEEWEYDKWYRFDVVLTMGANPKASIYVNGEPLTVDPDHGNGTTASYNDLDATFDGVNVTSENLDIGTWVVGEETTFEKMGLWGFDKAFLFQTHVTQAENLTHVVYIDELAYRELPPSAVADIPDAFTFEGMKNGGAFKKEDISNVKVNVPAFIEHKTASVEVVVNGTPVSEKQDAPLTYDLSTLNYGAQQVALTAKDAEGNVLDTANMSFTLPPADNIHGKGVQTYGDTENTGKFWWIDTGEGYYYGSTKKDTFTQGYQMYTAPGGPDGENDYFVKMEKDETASWTADDGETIVNASTGALVLGYRVNHNYGAQPENDRKNWKDGIVRVNYDIYIQFEGADWNSSSNWNLRPLQIGIGRKDVVPMVHNGSDVRTQYYFGNGALGNGFNMNKITDRWVHHEWILDYENKYVQFLRDGVAVNGADGTPYFPMYKDDGTAYSLAAGFEGVWFTFDANKGWLGIDNLDVQYELAVPYVKAVNFGEGNAKGNKVLTTSTTAAVEIPGMVFSADGADTMANYVSLIDSMGVEVDGSSSAMDEDGKTVNVTIPAGALTAGEDYQIKLAAGVPYGREGHTMKGQDVAIGDPSDPDNYTPAEYTVFNSETASVYSFTAVESLDDEEDDGVADNITVTGARFTKHGTRIDLNPVVGVNGSNLTVEDNLRAELKVSNAQATAKTCTIVMATYSGNELVDIAINTVKVPAYAKDATITSAPIVIDETAITAKAFLVDGIGTLAPLSYAYDILGNIAR